MKDKRIFLTLLLSISFCMPQYVIASDKVLFYMHGSDMHGKSENHKNANNYRAVVERLENEGFDVVFEFRTEHDAQGQAERTAEMVREKIQSGVAPENIIVAGFSYGAMVSLITSGLVANDKVNYALFCGCPENPSINIDIDYEKVVGNVLSIVDEGDTKFGTCQNRLPSVSTFQEKIIDSGKGHKIFKLKKDKFLDQWVPIFTRWVE